MKYGMVGCSLFSRRSLHTTLHLRGVQDTPLSLWEGREGFVTISFVSRALTLVLLGIFVGSCRGATGGEVRVFMLAN